MTGGTVWDDKVDESCNQSTNAVGDFLHRRGFVVGGGEITLP
jgi:hypothetical protein